MGQTGLYVHVPFCQAKCGYCDFYSVTASEHAVGPLVGALVRELETRLRDGPRPVTTIFVGGGTPTFLPPDRLARLLKPLKRVAERDRASEFTVEANPGSVDPARLELLIEGGVDRISIGAQSFHLRELETLGRLHRPADVADAVTNCRRHGIRRVNLDLIFGVPGQTLATWRQSLRRAVELNVDHIACYGLTYEPGTPLQAARARGDVRPCPEELEVEMYLAAVDDLAAAGLEQYEISAFARPGGRCRHNLAYWHNLPCIGVGPSAAGYLSGTRYKNIASIDGYIQSIDRSGHAVVQEETLTGLSLAGETAMLRLRLNEGLLFDAFQDRTGVDARTAFAEPIAEHVKSGWLALTHRGVALTRTGRLMADTVLRDFVACGPALFAERESG